MTHEFDSGSFRDRTSRVFHRAGGVYRALNADALSQWQAVADSPFFDQLARRGLVIPTEQVTLDEPPPEGGEPWAGVLKHRRIPFVSYPYEWTFGMLQDAALLQLELLSAALDEGFTLKDATPYNVQWLGSRPVFIDVASFTQLEPGTPWTGYRQFCELQLYPLLLQAYKGLDFQPWLRGSIDGISPAQCDRLMSARDRLRPGVLRHVYLHARLQGGGKSDQQDVRRELRDAGFSKELIKANVRGLRKLIERLKWNPGRSQWSTYSADDSYERADAQAKRRFVERALTRRRWDLVWDVGCNTGDFARLAAEQGGYVVAMDSDHLAVEQLYQSLKSEGEERILPLCVNVADPSPNLGWRGQERRALPARGTPSLTMCLALVHHLSISANLPLADIVEWLASLDSAVIVEFVTKDDPQTQSLLRNKDDIYADYTREHFEQLLGRAFEIVDRIEMAGGRRILYLAELRR